MKRGSKEWIDSMNRAADSMVEAMHRNYERSQKADTTKKTSTVIEPLDTKYNFYKRGSGLCSPCILRDNFNSFNFWDYFIDRF